jgi:Ser/Thr protein kinase RdoA (MazF antagonist)
MNEAHLKRLIYDYDLGQLLAIHEITEGILNNNYILDTTKGKYFVKSIRDKRKSSATYIAAVEEFMFSKGIPAVKMMHTRTAPDEKFVMYDEKVYTLYPFIESDRSHIYTNEEYKKMGELLGKIHTAGSSDVSDFLAKEHLTVRTQAVILNDIENIRKIISSKDGLDEIDLKNLRYMDIKERLAKELVNPIELTDEILVHGDFHTGNLLIDGISRKIIGVCDWEKAGMIPHQYALAQSIMYIFFEPGFELERALESASYFIQGYTSIFPTTREEFSQGLQMRIERMILTTWIENLYYHENDNRANKFLDSAIELLEIFTSGPVRERVTNLI